MVPPKHGSERVLHVPEALTDLLAQHVQVTGVWGEDGWLFGASTLLHRNAAGHLWRRARLASGLNGEYTLHDLRHFFASGLIASGCDVVTVQSALGHSDATITLKVYAHLWPKAEDRTRAAVADLMRVVSADNSRTIEVL